MAKPNSPRIANSTVGQIQLPSAPKPKPTIAECIYPYLSSSNKPTHERK